MLLSKKGKGQISDLVSHSGLYIGPLAKAQGEVKTNDDIFIDCDFRGQIETSGAVELGYNSVFEGSVQSRSLTVEGSANGDFKVSDYVKIISNSELKGNIESKDVIIDSGSKLNANIKTE